MEEAISEKWILWYHSINDHRWGKDTYKKIYTISTLYDYQYVYDIYHLIFLIEKYQKMNNLNDSINTLTD